MVIFLETGVENGRTCWSVAFGLISSTSPTLSGISKAGSKSNASCAAGRPVLRERRRWNATRRSFWIQSQGGILAFIEQGHFQIEAARVSPRSTYRGRFLYANMTRTR